jgi:hypothetical protein
MGDWDLGDEKGKWLERSKRRKKRESWAGNYDDGF